MSATAFKTPADLAEGVLSSSGALGNTTSPITVAYTGGANFPANGNFYVWIFNGSSPLSSSDLEKAVGTISGGNIVLTRANAISHTGTPNLWIVDSAQQITDIQTAINNIENGVTTLATVTSAGAAVLQSTLQVTGGVTLTTALTVANGGTGAASFTQFMPVCGGTSGTAALQSVATGAVGQWLQYQGSAALPSWAGNCLCVNTSAGSAVANTGAATSLSTGMSFAGSQTIPANWFGAAGRSVRVRASGVYSLPGASNPTLTLKIELGSTVVCTLNIPFAASTAATNASWSIDVVVTCWTTGSSGTVMANGGGSTVTVPIASSTGTTAGVTVNLTSSQKADVVATWSSAVSGSSITMTNFFVEALQN